MWHHAKLKQSNVCVNVYGKSIILPMNNCIVTLEKANDDIVNIVTKFQDGRTQLEPINCKVYDVTSDKFLQNFYSQEVQLFIKRQQERETELALKKKRNKPYER